MQRHPFVVLGRDAVVGHRNEIVGDRRFVESGLRVHEK